MTNAHGDNMKAYRHHAEVEPTDQWQVCPHRFRHLFKTLPKNDLGRHCRKWPAGKADLKVARIIQNHSQPHDLTLYTDGSVRRWKSGWGFCVKKGATTIHEDSAAFKGSTSSLTMEKVAISNALRWLASNRYSQTTRRAIILTDSMNLISKANQGRGSPDWFQAMQHIHLESLMWMYCPAHAGVKGNEQADWLARNAVITDDRKW
ncbi:RNase H family protein [Thiolapillus sp.]